MEIKGFTYGFDGRKGMFENDNAEKSMQRLAELGTNWVSFPVVIMQDTFASSKFGFDYRFNVTDREVENTVIKLKKHGMKVCLKPMINCADGVWRARIDFPEPDWGMADYWKEWFSCYNAFICHYAEIAEYTGCEMLCIGCEMVGTEKKSDYWRELIANVRKIYSGKLVYNANHGKERGISWFDALDYIGTSAYYPVADGAGENVEIMCERWKVAVKDLKALSDEMGKKVIFMEIGCRSASGCAAMPWDFTHKDCPYDEDEQANFYDSCMNALWNEDWLLGFFWWDWYTFLPENKTETGFSIYGKKTENVVKKWYSCK